MTDRKRLAAAAAVVVIAGAVALLALDGRSAAPRPAAAPAAAPPSSASARPAVASDAPPTPPDATPPPVAPPAIRGPRSASAGAAWEEVPVALRAHELGRELARDVRVSLEEARGGMEPCFATEAKALQHVRAAPADPDRPFGGPGVLILRIESRAGALDVVDVEVDALGTSTAALAACCRNVLHGWRIPAAQAVPGKRYRLAFPLL